MDLMEAYYGECPCEHMSEDDKVHRAIATSSTSGERKCEGSVEDCGISIAASTLEECRCRGSTGIS